MRVDLVPYGTQLELLQNEMDDFCSAVDDQLRPYMQATNDSILLVKFANSIQQVITQELDRFNFELTVLRQLYNDICVLFLHRSVKLKGGREMNKGSSTAVMSATVSRNKRSILGFLTSLFSQIFGVPSKRDWTLAQANLDALHRTTSELKQNMINSMHIINMTHAEVMVNHQSMNHLSVTVKRTQHKFYSLLTSIENEIINNLQFSTIVDRIYGYFG